MRSEPALTLLTELLTDLRQIQIQLIQWLPILATRIRHSGLRHMVLKHASDSSSHLTGLDQFFALHHTSPVEGTSKPIKLIIDGYEGASEVADPDRSDLILLIQILRVEEFEITSYEIVARVAEQLGFSEYTETLLEFLARRDSSAGILRELQSEMLKNAFPTEMVPTAIFPE